MNWKCPVCGNDDNSEGLLRCLCGHEIVETDIPRLRVISTPPMHINRSIWKDSIIVIVVSFVVAAISLPFKDILPILLKIFVHNYTPIVGYLFICYVSNKVEVWRLSKVALTVWAILTPIYTVINWNSVGTKYTVKKLVFGELLTEIISVIIGASLYFIVRKIKNTISIKNALEKPKWLKENTVLMCIFNVAGFIFYDANSEYEGLEIFLFIVVISMSLLVLWYYWQGNNWARILVMLGSILSVLNLYDIRRYSIAQASVIVAEAVLGLYLLWWLNTQSVKTYFGKSKRGA